MVFNLSLCSAHIALLVARMGKIMLGFSFIPTNVAGRVAIIVKFMPLNLAFSMARVAL